MRYKFRGKRLDGEWVYGSLVAVGGMTETYWILESDGIFKDNILPESVGQWTGLVDRHGKEIFEGDVLRNVLNPLYDNEPYFIAYDTWSGGWNWIDRAGNEDPYFHAIAKHSEIIGNLMDSPELMEVE